jgi:hypothetical protein
MKSALVFMLLLLAPNIARAETSPPTFEEKCTSTEASSNEAAANYDTHVFDVENKCDFSIRCDLNIAIYSAFGVKQGHKIVAIEPHGHGSVVLKIRNSGSLTERDHRCKPM